MTIDIKNQAKRALEQNVLRILEKEAVSFGHTALPQNKLLKKLLRSKNDTKETIQRTLDGSELINQRSDEKGNILYAPYKSYLLEKQITEQIVRLSTTYRSSKKFGVLTKKDMRLGKGITPSDEQLSAVNNAIQNGVSVITGGPGTGKTTMILGLVRALKSLKLSITLCAPTGKAAKRLGEATGLQKFNPSTIHMHLLDAARQKAFSYDVMIVDEASMVDAILFHSLLSTIPDGARLILIGDKNQLPPVSAGQPFKDIITTLEAHENYSVGQLRIKPENGVSGIISAAYDVITGNEPNPRMTLDNHDFEFVDCSKDDISNLVLDYYFEHMPKALGANFEDIKNDIQILSPQKKGSAGITELNIKIQNKLNANGTPLFEDKDTKRLFINDRVMQVSNDYELGVMNGEIGCISSQNQSGISVNLDKKSKLYNDKQAQNLDLAYSISIHKSQGSEYSAVIVPISSEHSFMLNRSLIYTAITRGKNKVCLIGEREVLKRTLKNGFKGTRYTGLGIELDHHNLADKISMNRLTEVYRQKKQLA